MKYFFIVVAIIIIIVLSFKLLFSFYRLRLEITLTYGPDQSILGLNLLILKLFKIKIIKYEFGYKWRPKSTHKDHVNRNYKKIIGVAIKTLKLIKLHFIIEKLNVKGSVGTDDAAFTAGICALLNIAFAITAETCFQKIESYPFIEVKPNFNKTEFNMSINCIVKSKITHIISIIKLFKALKL